MARRRKYYLFDDTVLVAWFERDRSHVSLQDKKTGETLLELWDKDIEEAVEDGFLDPRRWHRSMYELATYLGTIEGDIARNPTPGLEAKSVMLALGAAPYPMATSELSQQVGFPASRALRRLKDIGLIREPEPGKWMSLHANEPLENEPLENPPVWVRDPAIWERAKEQVLSRDGAYREPFAVVTHVYKRMGGRVKRGS